MTPAGATLRINALEVRYPGQVQSTLNGVDVVVRPGEVTAVVGPNGSGKSTIVRALLRVVPVRSGAIVLDDVPVTALSPREFATRVAVVTQREEPAWPLQVGEFVAMGRHPHRAAFGALGTTDMARINEALARAGVADAVHRRTDQLSGGEWQRVRIARALAQDAPVLVLDEPTTYLDIAHEMAVFELLDALAAEGRTVLLVSHQLNLVARFASHLVVLHQGRVAADGAPAEVMRGELLERVYDWPLVVTRDPAVGAPALLPLRRRAERRE